MSILRAPVHTWLRSGLENAAGLLRLCDERGRALLPDSDLGECLALGLCTLYQPFGIPRYEGAALTPKGRAYLALLEERARLAEGATHPQAADPRADDPRVCRRNPFEDAAREGGA